MFLTADGVDMVGAVLMRFVIHTISTDIAHTQAGPVIELRASFGFLRYRHSTAAFAQAILTGANLSFDTDWYGAAAWAMASHRA